MPFLICCITDFGIKNSPVFFAICIIPLDQEIGSTKTSKVKPAITAILSTAKVSTSKGLLYSFDFSNLASSSKALFARKDGSPSAFSGNNIAAVSKVGRYSILDTGERPAASISTLGAVKNQLRAGTILEAIGYFSGFFCSLCNLALKNSELHLRS